MIKRILKTVGWISLVLLVIVSTIVLVEMGRGYSYDFGSGRLKLNGLIIFSSTPSGADIAINGHSTRHHTPYRSTLEAGEYSFDITKAGYRSWSKRIDILGSEVSWAQYVLLLPNQLSQSTWFTTSGGISLLTTSQDHHHFAYVNNADGAVWAFDTGNHAPTRIYVPQAPIATQPVEVVTALAWSGDASRLLVTTKSADKTYQRLIDASGANPVKLTEQYGFDLAGLRFNPTNARQLFWLSSDGLRRIDTDTQSLSAVLAAGVVSYDFGASGQIIFVQPTQLGNAVFSMDTGGQGKRQLIESVATSPGYQLAYISYRGSAMLAILPSGSRTITLYTQITTDNPVARVLTKSADEMKFNADGRFLNYRNGQRLSTFDQELNRTYNFGNSKTPYTYLNWFDTYHLLVENAGSLSLVEFDGANDSQISTNFTAGLAAFTSNQHEVLVTKPTTSAGAQLEAISIKP